VLEDGGYVLEDGGYVLDELDDGKEHWPSNAEAAP
jgi:hypothetical protein